MSSANDLTKLVPGFDFLQGLMKGGGTAMPGIGQWIAPTLEPEELQRRIDELRTVQFWLEQNGKLIGTTIQALEVQRMTLATLKGMNLPLAEMTQSLLMGGAAAKSPAARAPAAAGPAPAAGKPATAPIDPLQWWGALTQQFTELATKALKDSQTEMARNLSGAAMAEGPKAAGDSIGLAMSMPGRAARSSARAGQAVPKAAKPAAAGAQAGAPRPAPARRRKA